MALSKSADDTNNILDAEPYVDELNQVETSAAKIMNRREQNAFPYSSPTLCVECGHEGKHHGEISGVKTWCEKCNNTGIYYHHYRARGEPKINWAGHMARSRVERM